LNNNVRTTNDQIKFIEEYMKKYNIPYDYIDDGKQGKIIANAYIDDCAIEFNPDSNKHWDYVLEQCKRRFC